MASSDPDRQLAKRLSRDARLAAKVTARAHALQVKAVRRRQKAVARARRALPVQGGVLLGSTAWAIADNPGVGVGIVGFLAMVGGIRSVGLLMSTAPQPEQPRLPTPPLAPPPDPRSAAWPAVRRLEAVRQELVRLLPLVARPGRAAAEEAWHAAAESDAALRWQAARLAAVEPHRGADPELLRPLFLGVEAQEQLVVAVADLVAACADPRASARLQDATDALHGLAQGLREVR